MAQRRPALEPREPRRRRRREAGGVLLRPAGPARRRAHEARRQQVRDPQAELRVRRAGQPQVEDKSPAARDEFSYGPDGARHRRKTTFAGGGPEHTYHVGGYEELLPGPGAVHRSIEQTRVTDAVRHVRAIRDVTDAKGNKKPVEDNYVDYVHKDHLGSAEGTTDASGSRTRALAHDPFGGRRKADWTRALTESERAALAGSSLPRTRGHTGHEHLDRTGFIHRGGRLHDPTLGRFLSPDPLVSDPGSAQSWNGYSYVSNSPMSFVDPSGLSQRQASGGCVMSGFMCRQGAGGAAGGGFGLETVVSTFSFWFVDVLVSWVPTWNHDPDWIFGEWDSFDPFRYEYVYRQGSITVTSQVPVAGVLNLTRRDIVALRFDFGNDDRMMPQAFWGAVFQGILRAGKAIIDTGRKIKKWVEKRPALQKERENAKKDADNRASPPTGGFEDGEGEPLSVSDKQLGKKFGEHMDPNRPGYRTDEEYRQLAEQIYNNPDSEKIVFPEGGPQYPGETHYQLDDDLLRLDPEGNFRSLYPVK